MTHIVLRSELITAYLDPIVGPRDILAWVPEAHASPRCERAVKKGRYKVPIDKVGDPIWCETCTTEDPDQATLRLIDGEWQEVTADG